MPCLGSSPALRVPRRGAAPDGVGAGGRRSRRRAMLAPAGWRHGRVVEHYGESADHKTLSREYGFTAEAVTAADAG